MRRRWIYLIVAALVIGGGAVFLTQRPLMVTVVRAEKDVPLRIYGLGTVEARVLSRVGFEVGAALLTLNADAGDHVAKGQELATLHPAEQEARVARARAAVEANAASLTKAQAGVERARAVLAERDTANRRLQELARKDVASVQRAEEAQRDVDVARAELSVAEADAAVVAAQGSDAAAALKLEETLLAHHRLAAPYDAGVVARHAEPGTVVKAGDPIFTLTAPASVWIQAYIDEERAGQLALGQPGAIRLRSQPQKEFAGTIARIGLAREHEQGRERIAAQLDVRAPRVDDDPGERGMIAQHAGQRPVQQGHRLGRPGERPPVDGDDDDPL